MPKRQTAAVERLRDSEMMAHLLDALDDGQLVFTLVARHFMDEDELTSWMTKDLDISEDDARSLWR